MVALPLTGLHAIAQTAPPVQPAQFDPSDVYFQGYLAARAAEQLEKDGDFIGAYEKLEQARKLFEGVSKYYPAWKPEMVKGRSEKNAESIAAIGPKAHEQRQKNQGIVAELEGGVRQGARPMDPADPIQPAPGILEVDPIASRRLAEAEAEVARIRGLMGKPVAPSSNSELERQRDSLAAQLRAAQTNAESLRARLTAQPVESELKSLNSRIEGLEQEREAMGRALTQSRGAHTDALARIATLEADLNVMRTQASEMRQKESNLDRDLKTERKIANEVVAGQRRQLETLEKALEMKSGELAKANERIAGLTQELDQSREAFAELRDERDSLLQERDQMSALLKLNEAGRINELIEQNMGLAKNLREANEKVERLNIDNNAAKDDIVDALRDLAIAKSQINKLHQEKRAQDDRLAELEKRLQREETALVKGESSASAAETEVLRDIIKRQLRVQERRRQARDLLLEAVKELGQKDEQIANAVQLFDGNEIQLTPEEQKLIADKQVDGEFISPFARDRGTVVRATSDLNRELEGYDRAATKAFVAGRLLPTRELFQMIVEAHPGNSSALCKLGVVHLRLEDASAAADTFRRAVELDDSNPYAHRMLGFSAMSMGDLMTAEQSVARSVELAPDDAKSQTLLGAISYRLGKFSEAESHYKAAITADPVPSEPYFNLALLCARNKRFDNAREYYNQALERGAIPDAGLERRLLAR